MSKQFEIGKRGEKFVCEYLKNKGYFIVCTNYHSIYGEIDIISKNDKYILFVEVKSRRETSFYRGIEAVNKGKRIKIIKTAFEYIASSNIDMQFRFDVAEVSLDSSGIPKSLYYYENCFGADECDAFF